MLKADFLDFDSLESLSYTDKTTSGGTAYTVNNARKTFQTVQGFGETNVKGYGIGVVRLTFPVDELAVSCKLGDTFSYQSNTYEVTSAELKTASTRWLVEGARAFIDTDFAQTTSVERATITKDSASGTVKTWAAVYSSQSTIVMDEDDVADMIPRLGVRSDKKTLSFFYPQTLTIEPLDRVVYGGRYYRITQIVDAGRVARLLRIRGELYA